MKYTLLMFALLGTFGMVNSHAASNGNLGLFGTPKQDENTIQGAQTAYFPQTKAGSGMVQSQVYPAMPELSSVMPVAAHSRMFGVQLFGGMFRNSLGSGFNPNYQVSIGDRVLLRLWGAFNFEGTLAVDPQGNIFLPNVGPVKVAGVRNSALNSMVESQVRRVFRNNVGVYAALDVAQPVKVFVTGFVKQPGLYGGVAADSLLSYLDKAGGVDPDRGSYVDIIVKRGEQVRKRINLYDFLLNGSIDLIQFSDGDVILVAPRKHTFAVDGEVFNAYDFEFDQPTLTLERALEVARPKPGATHVSIVRKQGTQKRSEYYPIDQAKGVMLQDGDELRVSADRYAGTIQVRIEGAHSGEHAIVLPYGASMKDVLDRININSMSRVDQLLLFRRSVALRQKEMLDVALNKLQESVLSARSSTSEEATLRVKEAELIGKFVEQARKVEPKGQVVLNEKTLVSTLLEDGDIIRIPEKTSLVMVHGEVLFPNAISWQNGQNAGDYIEQVGGFTQGSDTSKVIIIRQNGEAVQAGRRSDVVAGDEIMVLPKIESKSIEVTRGISTILYQIAIAAKVIIGL
ncbi:polysaccharide biosynthesis/export family protein [Vogesella indigofera]|uniref:polysaccharide biosynthesis/export family protein n=1 Tax=Vogesella indigofera TaxID=45465 RepID=UPI00234F9EEF|nr:polysaccharide biosynthesis/export family protein [Vogesella indigofera]MDC7710850.1 polysaccharide export protein [Vogesella indigofera]